MKKYIKIGEKKYHIPDINFDQLDHLFEAFPEMMNVLQSEAFDHKNPGHAMFAIMRFMTGSPLKKLAAILLAPERETYWYDDLYDENLKVVGRISTQTLYSEVRDENGKLIGIKPGEMLDAFFGAVPILGELRGSFDFSTIAQPKPMQASAEDSEDTAKD